MQPKGDHAMLSADVILRPQNARATTFGHDSMPSAHAGNGILAKSAMRKGDSADRPQSSIESRGRMWVLGSFGGRLSIQARWIQVFVALSQRCYGRATKGSPRLRARHGGAAY